MGNRKVKKERNRERERKKSERGGEGQKEKAERGREETRSNTHSIFGSVSFPRVPPEYI